jgi:6-phosphogluconolactonase (cycloisomerase 2 family)
LQSLAEVDPSFLTFHPRRQFLFAVSEGLGLDGGAVASLQVDGPTGRLTPLTRQPSLCGEPCHLCCDPTGRWVVGRQNLTRAQIGDADAVLDLFRLLFTTVQAAARSHQELVLENLLLRRH